jgi:hypothetical protein
VDERLRDWLRVSLFVGLGLSAAAALLARGSAASGYDVEGLRWALAAGVALTGLAILIALAHRRVRDLLLRDDPATPAWPGTTLFAASFVALFLEMALIRYTGSQIRIFAFYKNVPLIAAYLGLGLGCALGGARPRSVLLLLLWSLPLAVCLGAGSFAFARILSQLAAMARTEHVLGDAAVQNARAVGVLGGQIGMGAFCLTTLFALASFFIPIGQLLGDAFERLPRLTAYTVNILGSLAGTGVFLLLGYFWTPPWVWMLVGLVPLLWWIADRRQLLAAGFLITLAALAVVPSVGRTI